VIFFRFDKEKDDEKHYTQILFVSLVPYLFGNLWYLYINENFESQLVSNTMWL
jgi:hypothetical protein